MPRILYVGNKLSHHGFTQGVIEILGPQLEGEGFQLSYAGTKKNVVFRLLQMISAIIQNLQSVDYILIDTYSSKAFWYAWLSAMLCRLLKLKYIHILHGGNLPTRLKRSKWFCNQIFPYSYANVAVSGYLKNAFDRVGYPVMVIPNNIDISNYQFKERNNLQVNLLWVRSFHQIYNPNMAADVLVLLLKDYPQAKLCMVGPDKDGSMGEFKSHCEKLRLTNHVKITGFLSKPEWHKLSEAYDIFINTTNVDNTPVSVIEAMALGLPVVSTDVGGISFLLENQKDALLVERANALAMYKAIKSLLENSSLALSIASHARMKVELFGWEIVNKQWRALLK